MELKILSIDIYIYIYIYITKRLDKTSNYTIDKRIEI